MIVCYFETLFSFEVLASTWAKSHGNCYWLCFLLYLKWMAKDWNNCILLMVQLIFKYCW